MDTTQSSAGQQTPPREYPMIDYVCMRLKAGLHAMEPSHDVAQHFRNARMEVLKGLRQMIDNRIQRLDRTGQHGQKITVE